MPLVSIIIPNYNSIKHVSETIISLELQTYSEYEVLVIDDGSTDGSYEYLLNLNHPFLKVYKNPKKGACAARNYGISLSKGKYVQFLDADDLISSSKIEKQVAALELHNNKIATCSTVHFYDNPENGKIVDRKFMFSTDKADEFLLNLYGGNGKDHNMVAQHAWLSPKAVINKAGFWNEELIKDQDGEFFCRVLMASEGVEYVENIKVFYRKHRKAQNVSSGKSELHLRSQLKALESKQNQLKKTKYYSAYKRAMALQFKLLAISAYPEYYKISKKSLQKSKLHGGSQYLPKLGGKIIESIKCIFGWKTAQFISYWIHKML